MKADAFPLWVIFLGAVIGILLCIEAGYRTGRAIHRRREAEKEASVSGIAGSVLGLVAFMLAFTFGIVAERHSSRKGLVREEANAIRTAWQRTDFLPGADRAEAVALMKEYLVLRLEAVRLIRDGEKDIEHMDRLRTDSERIQRRLWEMAAANARQDMDSDVAALYLQSLNQVTELHATRVAVGLQQRIPTPIWVVLCSLTVCGMAAMGYQTGITGAEESWARTLLAIAFSLVVSLIVSLDRPGGGVLKVSQQPLIDLRDSMESGSGSAAR